MYKGKKLKKFESKKAVSALKIKSIVRNMDKTATMRLELGEAFVVPAHIMAANPVVGQYYVLNSDKSVTFQDAKQFKAMYVELKKPKPADKPTATEK